MSDAKRNARRLFGKRDGRWYCQWREPGSRHVLKQLEHRWVWEMAHGPIPEGFHVHHINHDRCDNRLENLQIMPGHEHRDMHAREREDHRLIGGVEFRRCGRCHVYKPTAEFSRRAAGTYHGYCKRCVADYLRDWRRTPAGKQQRRDRYWNIDLPRRRAARTAVERVA